MRLKNGGHISHLLAAKILDETGVYKNLLQEVSQRVGASLPAYTTFRSGLGHQPVFTCIVELAGVTFTVEQQSENSSPDKGRIEEQEHVTVARALQIYLIKAKQLAGSTVPNQFSDSQFKAIECDKQSSVYNIEKYFP
nr:double-stranded RNA-binding protein 2-like [Ipomoea batatas]